MKFKEFQILTQTARKVLFLTTFTGIENVLISNELYMCVAYVNPRIFLIKGNPYEAVFCINPEKLTFGNLHSMDSPNWQHTS